MGQVEYSKMLLLPYRFQLGLVAHTEMPAGQDENVTQVYVKPGSHRSPRPIWATQQLLFFPQSSL